MDNKRRIVSPLVEYFESNDMMGDPVEILGSRMKSVEVKFTSANSVHSLVENKRFYFNPDSTLDGENCTITAIEFVTSTQQQYLSDGQTLNVTADTGARWMIGIADADNDLLVYSPLTCFYAPPFAKSGVKQYTKKTMMTHFTTQKWMSCFLEAIDSSTISASYGFKLNIYYTPN